VNKKFKLKLGGLPHKIHIRTNDENLPILLNLHGGPGVVSRTAVNNPRYLTHFTMVGYDQRGAGGSYWGARREELTIKQLTDDAAELTAWLCQRFGKDKLFLLGGSWGSELGTFLAHRYPAHIAAYVGYGQVVNGAKNETLGYNFALEAARNAGDKEAVAQLEQLGPPVKGVYKTGFAGLMLTRKIQMKHGGYSPKRPIGIYQSFVKPMVLSGEYSLFDLIGAARGYKFVLNTMWGECVGVDLAAECPSFDMPYFIFDGKHDHTTPASLVEEYFAAIAAPRKELIWFEHSGHSPPSDEPERFMALLREKLYEVAAEENARGVRV